MAQKTSTFERFGIAQFDGANFSNWKFRVETLLEQNEVLEHLRQQPGAVESRTDTWKKTERKCKSLLIQCIADTHLEYVKDKSTSYEIWKTLEKLFERKSISSQIYLRKKLLTLKYVENESMQEHILSFDRLLRELRSAGAKLEDVDAVCHLLLTLPSSYDNIVAALETVAADKLTLEFVKSRLMDEEMKRKHLQSKQEEVEVGKAAFSGNMRNRNNLKCYNCGKRGHKRSECRLEKKQFWKKSNQANSAEKQDEIGEGALSFMTGRGKILTEHDNTTFVMYIDSGATDHLINDDKLLTVWKKLEKPIEIKVAKDGETVKATKIGEIKGKCIVNRKTTECTLNNVLYVPGLRSNLLSVTRMNNAGIEVVFKGGCVELSNNGKVFARALQRNNLYEIKIERFAKAANICQTNDQNEVWHKRLGHLSSSSLQKLKKMKLLSEEINGQPLFCESCIKGKQTRMSFEEKRESRSRRPIELIHTDVCGPITPATINGKRYYVCFTDDYTRFSMTYLMETKSEVLKYFMEYEAAVSSQFSNRISRIRCDNGGEYVSKDFRNFCKGKGIQVEYTVPYTPQQNGISERKNRTLLDKARTMVIDAGLDKTMWGEAVLTATYLCNRSPTAKLDKIPAQLWFKKEINLKHLQTFGCMAYKHIPDEKRTKLEDKSEECIMIGYAPCGYRLFSIKENKVVLARDVIFNEKVLYKDWKNKNEKGILKTNSIYEEENSESLINESEEEDEQEEAKARRSIRIRKVPARFKDYLLEESDNTEENIVHFVNSAVCEVPENYEEAVNSVEKENWKKAIHQEMEALKKNKAWTLVDRPIETNTPIIDCKWVFQVKCNENGDIKKYKARLVARGFSQVMGINYLETYSPVANMATVRVLIAIANHFGWSIFQMDVKTAFLNGNLTETIYMTQPEGFVKNEKLVCKLNKSLYGLKQSSKCWNDCFNEYVTSIGFIRSKSDYCLYRKTSNELKIFILLYVDDILLTGNNNEQLKYLKQKLSEKFEMEDLGELKLFLSLNVSRNVESKTITLDQKQFILKILKRFKMQDCKGSSTPMEANLKLTKCENKENLTKSPYRELIGSLLYLSLGSRPDICFAVNYFSRFQDCASDNHWNHLKRIVRYLKQTIDYKLTFVDDCSGNILKCNVDSDWGNDIVDRKSVTGYILKLFNCPVIWTSKKQQTVSISSTEAEYLAVSSVCQEILWIKQLLEIFQLSFSKPVIVYEDNQGCIFIAKNPETKRSKHIDIKHHFVRELVESGKIELKYLPTECQQADIFTKSLHRPLYEKFRSMLGIELNLE